MELSTHVENPHQKPPRQIKLSLPRLGSVAVSVLLLVVAWSVFVSPNSYAKPLFTAMRAIKAVALEPGSAPPYARFELEPIRHTTGSVWAHDIASAVQSEALSEHTMGGLATTYHNPAIIMAIQKGASGLHSECTIRVSAQAFDHPGTPFSSLMTRIGSREDSFFVVLSHELAHCHWNPGMAFEERLEKVQSDSQAAQKMSSLMPLVVHIAESYADAYALIFAARIDADFFAKVYEALTEFRSINTSTSNIYRTGHAITAAAQMARTLPAKSSPLSVRWDITNRFVMSAALTGAMTWLTDQGMSQRDAVSNIAFVLEGQGIEFSAKIIAGQTYLIVNKAPDGLSQAVK